MYVYTLMLYRSNTGAGNDDIARHLLRKLKGANEARPAALSWKNQTCMQCHQDVHWLLQDMVPRHVEPIVRPVFPRDGHQCTGVGCGVPIIFVEWDM
jgi:hypothetical protein